MGRYEDHSGIENTCPAIDMVVDYINSLTKTDESNKALEILELIRDSNQKLRDWGNQTYEELEETKEQLEELKQTNAELTVENEGLQAQLDSLDF